MPGTFSKCCQKLHKFQLAQQEFTVFHVGKSSNLLAVKHVEFTGLNSRLQI